MSPTLVDHLLAFLLLVLVPLWGRLSWPAVLRRLAEDAPGVRQRLYLRGMLGQWGLCALVVVTWLWQGRSLVGLGLAWTTPAWGARGWALAVGLAAALAGLMAAQLAVLAGREEDHAAVREQLEAEVPFLPREPPEDRCFAALALTAGLCEELLYRGFCLAWAAVYIGSWPAVCFVGLFFGLAHSYQGPSGVLKTTLAGWIAGGLYVVGGTLWIPVVLHAFVDLHAGFTCRLVREGEVTGRP